MESSIFFIQNTTEKIKGKKLSNEFEIGHHWLSVKSTIVSSDFR